MVIDDEELTPVADHVRKKRGRKPLDPALPRVIVHHGLLEAERVCAHDGHALVEIGAEVSEQLNVSYPYGRAGSQRGWMVLP